MAQASGKSKRAAFVHCERHGTERHKIKQVRVGMPNGKNQRRFGGCPMCNRDKALQ